MRLPLTCLIFLASLASTAQTIKEPASDEKFAKFKCAEEQSLHSPSIPNKTSFTLYNKAKEPIKIFWISRDGQRTPYNDDRPIKVGASFTQDTYEGDIWVVTDAFGMCVAIFAAGKSHIPVVIKEDVLTPIQETTTTPPKKPTPVSSLTPLKTSTAIPPDPDIWKNLRSKSPFDGPPNPGLPDRLWIWTNKSSTLIDKYVDAEIGLANKSGPNCTATSSIGFNLACNACLIDGVSSREFRINPGERVVKTKVQIKLPKASLSATTRNLRSDRIELKGCAFSPQVFLGGSQKVVFGLADGATPVPFGLVFLDDSGQAATNQKEKTVLVSTGGPDINGRSARAGAVVEGATISIPSDQCEIELEARSKEAGHFRVDAWYLNVPAQPPLEFVFTYGVGWKDALALLVATVLGAATRPEVWQRRSRVQRLVGIAVSGAGAVVGFGLAYLTFVRNNGLPAPWLVLGVFGVVGSTLGVHAVLNLFLGRNGQGTNSPETTREASAH